MKRKLKKSFKEARKAREKREKLMADLTFLTKLL